MKQFRSEFFPLFFLISGMVLFVGCGGDDRDHPTDDISDEQRKLSERMAMPDLTVPNRVPLSSQLQQCLQMYAAAEDSCTKRTENVASGKLDSIVLELSSRLFLEGDHTRIIREMSSYLFDTLGIEFIDDRNNPDFLFPNRVLDNGKGSCVGLSLLFLLLAEKLDLPIYGVLVPEHMFVRYDKGESQRCNIETLRKGECMSNEWYRKTWNIIDTVTYPLENCTSEKVMAVVEYNIGTIWLSRKQFNKAADWFNRALKKKPVFPEAAGNLALALDGQGKPEKALELLSDLRMKYPKLKNINKNMAALLLRCKQYAGAEKSYSGLARVCPEDAEIYYGLGAALFHLKKNDEAKAALERALQLNDDYSEARELLGRVGK